MATEWQQNGNTQQKPNKKTHTGKKKELPKILI
jgi:hypothetical protein